MSAHTSGIARKSGKRRDKRRLPMKGDDAPVREKDDFYGTPPWVTHALLDANVVPFASLVWECAAGEGHIADVLFERGFRVVRTDLVDRGCGAKTPVDFLMEQKALAPWLITNPPFKLAQEFVDHALRIGVDHIALLLKLSFAQGASRTPWLFRSPLERLLIVPGRITFIAAQGREEFTSNFMDAYAWFVWNRYHQGPPILGMV